MKVRVRIPPVAMEEVVRERAVRMDWRVEDIVWK
jgi:hypothetical protein